jgi:hypothetical protein
MDVPVALVPPLLVVVAVTPIPPDKDAAVVMNSQWCAVASRLAPRTTIVLVDSVSLIAVDFLPAIPWPRKHFARISVHRPKCSGRENRRLPPRPPSWEKFVSYVKSWSWNGMTCCMLYIDDRTRHSFILLLEISLELSS